MEAPDYNQLRRTYSLCTNEELECLTAEFEGLTSEAKDALRFELRQRGLEVQDTPLAPAQAATQLPQETKSTKTSRWNWIWPAITNENQAKNAAKSGAYGALFVALCTGGLSILAIATGRLYVGIDGYGLVDATLFALIAWGLFRYSFSWAVFGLLLWLAEVYLRMSSNPRTIGAGTVIIALSLVASVRGTLFLGNERKSKELGISAKDTPDNSMGFSLPPARSSSLKFIPAAIICVGCLATLVYHRERVKEKDDLLAQMDKTDVENVALQIQKDIAALNKDYEAEDWSGFRSELLSREPYLIDLKAENEKVQRRLLADRKANLNVNDTCERLVIDEGEPALQAVMTAHDDLLSFAKNTTELSADKELARKLLSIQYTSAWNKWDQFIADQHSHDCEK
jgi:hypothetical protein